MARLDHSLVSEDWDSHLDEKCREFFQDLYQDYFPIMIEEGWGVLRGHFPFRFEKMWLKDEGFKELTKSRWQGFRAN